MTGQHLCYAVDCRISLGPWEVFCAYHFTLLPGSLRAEFAAYSDGMAEVDTDPHSASNRLVRRAIRIIQDREALRRKVRVAGR